MQIAPLEWILSAFVEKIKEMKMKQWILLLVSVFLFACSEDNSSSGEIQEESSSSVSEFSPIVFTKLSSNKLLSGESFKIGFSGTISVDTESQLVEDATTSKIDSIFIEVREVKDKSVSEVLFSKELEGDFPLTSVALNGEEILYDDLEHCGNFRVYFWAYASGSLESVYISVDSLEIEKEMEYCQEDVELPEEPESSSSVLEECSEMKMKTITLSTIASEQNRFADFEQGITSAEAEGMQVSLSVEEDILFLNVEEKSFELGEEYGNFRAGVVPEQVCEESLDVFPGTLGSELEIFQNAWVILKSEKKTYLLLIGKRTDAEGGSSVEITYWK